MPREVGQNVKSGEKNSYGENRLGEIGELDQEVFCKKRKGGILFHKSAEFVEDVEHQPKNEEGGDNKKEGNEY